MNQQREKQYRLKDLRDKKISSTHVLIVSEIKEKEFSAKKKKIGETTTSNFPNFVKYINIQVQEVWQS